MGCDGRNQDVSIWLHQVVKGFQDSQGNPVPNAHLLGLFHRVCKLLFYKIKPVFVFDGGVPHLKKQTVALRRQQRSKAELEAERVRTQLLKSLVKDAALKRALGSSIDHGLLLPKHPKENDMYVLPPEKKVQDENTSSLDGESESSEDEYHTHRNWSTADLHAIDVNSSQFKSLPADVRHDILSELKETRKQSSWGRLHEMPKMSRLLKRRSVQVSLEDAEREMGGRSLSIGELEELLNEQGVVTNSDAEKRIASDNTTRYLYVNEIGNKLLPSSKSELKGTDEIPSSSQIKEENKKDEKVEDIPVHYNSKVDYLRDVLEFIPEEEDKDWSSNSGNESDKEGKAKVGQEENLKIAQNFIFENSGLTQEQILAVIQYQNVVENDTSHGIEIVDPIDQPSTSGLSTSKQFNKNKIIGDPEKIVESTSQEVKIMEDKNYESNKTCAEGSVQEYYNEKHSTAKSISINFDKSTSKGNCSVEHVSSKLGICPLGIENSVNDSVKLLKEESKLFKTNKEYNDCEALSAVDVSNKESDELGNQQQIDSDTDDSLIEVNDEIPVQTVNNTVSSKALEVVIQTNKKCELEDDIFADVFTTKSSANPLLPAQDKTINILENVNKDRVVRNKTLEVVIQTEKTCELEDDIFADVFTAKSSANPLLPAQDKTINILENVNKDHVLQNKTLEVVIQTKKTCELEDDIFADVFETNSCENSLIPIQGKNININEDIITALPVMETNRNGVNTSVEDSQHSSDRKAGKDQNLTTAETLTENEILNKEQIELVADEKTIVNQPVASTSKVSAEEIKELQLFGIPYIVAPMEAEAQCAFLDFMSLTDGTITDDSDIWLFELERQQMIQLALLVGSDYTPGLQGIGPVTALEVLASFPSTAENVLTGLQQFREWLNGGMKVGPGKTPLKNKLKNVQFSEGFPSQAVVEAYLKPKVDESMETFSWQFPDLDSLREFTKKKFKWTKLKADEILLPVMKKLEERKSQRSLDSYFKIIPKLHAAEGKLSKRVKQAINRIGGAVGSENEDEPSEGQENLQSKRRRIEPKATKPKSSRGRGRGRGINPISNEQIQPTATNSSSQVQPVETNTSGSTYSEEFIPQRERDKINALKSKLRAIEVFRRSKIDTGKKKQNKFKRRMLKEAKLSESSSDSE
ncbi:hypothetical protein C0J52_05251 [Blattella germanica]|nr:hypothetical protein C0J52_05251 [Blattella germanica]